MLVESRTILDVRNLTVGFRHGDGIVRAVEDVSFSLGRGEMLALVGESGSGKSVSSLAIMGLLQEDTAVIEGGSIRFCGRELTTLDPEERRQLRGKRMAMIFQEPMTALNPVLTIGWQISEVLREHENMTQAQAHAATIELLGQVGIPSAELRYNSYPHQLSGGMRQRVMIAMALACRPELLIADEPTTALDVTVQAQIMELLSDLRVRLGTAVLFVTHNLALVREQADRVAVMVSGHVVELATASVLFSEPCHPYTRLLLRCVPQIERRGRRLAAISGAARGRLPEKGCAFYDRCPYRYPECGEKKSPLVDFVPGHSVRCLNPDAYIEHLAVSAEAEKLQLMPVVGKEVLHVSDLKVWFPVRSGILNRVTGQVKAVDGVDLCLHAGETVALVGESGCGKTTAGKALVRLVEPTGGSVVMPESGVDLVKISQRQMAYERAKIQMIFQDPFSSLDPRLMIAESLREGLRIRDRKDADEECRRLLDRVGLPPDALWRYPHQFSGGQRQRIGLARALTVKPKIIICDECTSALDVSVQAQILNLLRGLQTELGIAYLFITHDLSVVSYFADRVAVMYLGRIVEEGPAEDVFASPRHPYTKALLAAAPKLNADGGVDKIRLDGDVPSPVEPPPGCHFHPRCIHCTHRCRVEAPPLRMAGLHHTFSCWRE
ncbi:MAG: ABC transporter ATP-binding protein [Victivallales bacterium]|nr:ABC transporter ATP-binding protein [Victivallales bacterium]